MTSSTSTSSQLLLNSKYTVITHPMPHNNHQRHHQQQQRHHAAESVLPTKPAPSLAPRLSSLANQRPPRDEGPPSYDSYLRRKNSKRKKVNFQLDGVTVGESGTDDAQAASTAAAAATAAPAAASAVEALRSDMPYPLRASCDDLHSRQLQFKSQPKPLRSSLKKTPRRYYTGDRPGSPKSDTYCERLRQSSQMQYKSGFGAGVGAGGVSGGGRPSIDSDHSFASVVV